MGTHGRRARHAVEELRVLARAVDRAMGAGAGHADRVARLADALAAACGWERRDRRRLLEAAALHDIGKSAVPVSVLRRRGPLGPQELALVRRHAELGAAMAARALDPLQAAWIRGHHERWDGTGYPDGLAGREIPQGAALLALADAWDAMTSTRPYAPARSPLEALEVVRAERGGQFAPAAVEALERLDQTGALLPA